MSLVKELQWSYQFINWIIKKSKISFVLKKLAKLNLFILIQQIGLKTAEYSKTSVLKSLI